MNSIFGVLVLLMLLCHPVPAQERSSSPNNKQELGAKTARGGFRNEDEIRDKFNAWKSDSEAREWLEAMAYQLSEIQEVSASKPHGEKADVEVRVKTTTVERVERISIKLVSNPNGFNQVDKRWLTTYTKMWHLPPDVQDSLKLFVGETPPHKSSRNSERMFLNELNQNAQKAVITFFTHHRVDIAADLLAGDGEHAADWMLVTSKVTNQTKWGLWPIKDVVQFFVNGDVVVTRAGSLKIGRITMQRKGGDNGRPGARMLQFKINPAELFELQESDREHGCVQ